MIGYIDTDIILPLLFDKYVQFNKKCVIPLFIYTEFKATFSFYKLIPKKAQMTTYILIGHCTSLSPLWFIILDKNNFVKLSHNYLKSGGYQVFF